MAMCRVLGVQRQRLLRVAAFTARSARAKGRSATTRSDQSTRGWTVRSIPRWPSQDRHELAHGWVRFASRHRVRRLMKQDGLRALVGYDKRPRALNGSELVRLPVTCSARAFKAAAPGQSRVTDVTHIRTYEGFLYLAVVLDLFSRQIVGWATAVTTT